MAGIYIAPLSKALYNWGVSFTIYVHTPTAIGGHARSQPARQEQLRVRCLARGHFDAPGGGSNRQPSDCRTTALTSWAVSPHTAKWMMIISQARYTTTEWSPISLRVWQTGTSGSVSRAFAPSLYSNPKNHFPACLRKTPVSRSRPCLGLLLVTAVTG